MKLWYDAVYDKFTKKYKTEIIFAIPYGALKVTSFEPTNIKTLEGKFSEEELVSDVSRALENKEGTVLIMFDENENSKIESGILAKSSDKFIYYVPIPKKVVFKRVFQKDTFSIYQDLFNTKNTSHIVAFWWNDTLSGIKVDTLEKIEGTYRN